MLVEEFKHAFLETDALENRDKSLIIALQASKVTQNSYSDVMYKIRFDGKTIRKQLHRRRLVELMKSELENPGLSQLTSLCCFPCPCEVHCMKV